MSWYEKIDSVNWSINWSEFYDGEWYQSDELDIHDEIIDRIDLNEENV